MEYVHMLLVPDLDWRATKAHGEAIHGVLHAWGLAPKRPSLYAHDDPLCREGRQLAAKTIRTSDVLPPEFSMLYDPSEVAPQALERVLGRARLRGQALCSPAPFSIGVQLGVAYKLCGALDVGFAFVDWEQTEAEWEAGEDVGPRDPLQRRPDEPPPRTKVRCVDHDGKPTPAPRGFSGLYRSALSFDCGKLFPTFVKDGPLQLPNRDFVRDLSSAFETPLVEMGLVE